jgi:hypothetical protein
MITYVNRVLEVNLGPLKVGHLILPETGLKERREEKVLIGVTDAEERLQLLLRESLGVALVTALFCGESGLGSQRLLCAFSPTVSHVDSIPSVVIQQNESIYVVQLFDDVLRELRIGLEKHATFSEFIFEQFPFWELDSRFCT